MLGARHLGGEVGVPGGEAADQGKRHGRGRQALRTVAPPPAGGGTCAGGTTASGAPPRAGGRARALRPPGRSSPPPSGTARSRNVPGQQRIRLGPFGVGQCVECVPPESPGHAGDRPSFAFALEHAPELAHGGEGSCLHGSEGKAPLIRDASLGPALKIRQLHHLSLLRRPTRARRTSTRRAASQSSRVTMSAMSSSSTGSGFTRAERRRSRSSRRTVSTARWSTRERKKDRRSPRRIEGLGGAPEGHEGVVDDLLGQQVVAGDAEGEPVGRRRVQAVELLERRALAHGQASLQAGVPGVHLACVHPAFLPDRSLRW